MIQTHLMLTILHALLNLRDDSAEVRRLVGNAKLDYKLHFFEDITATVNIGLDKSNSHGRTFTSGSMPTSNPTFTGSYGGYGNTGTDKLFDAYLTYSKVLNDAHSINFVAGHSYQSFERDDYGFGRDLTTGIETTGGIDKSKNVLLSYFGRANYDYQGKYLLTATLRADASSKLNPDDRWGYFPSFAVAWNVNK